MTENDMLHAFGEYEYVLEVSKQQENILYISACGYVMDKSQMTVDLDRMREHPNFCGKCKRTKRMLKGVALLHPEISLTPNG